MESDSRVIQLKDKVKAFIGFPKPGIIFWDIFSILRDPPSFKLLIQLLRERIQSHAPKVDIIMGLDARGFLFGSMLAYEFGIPFTPARKKGKLPGKVAQVSYTLEYGKDCLETPVAAINPGNVVIIVDDLLATGGTMKAATELVTSLGGEVALCLVCIELIELKGREKLNHKVDSILTF